MGVCLNLLNFNTVFSQLKQPPVIVNDLVNSSIEQKEKLNSTILTAYSSDLLSNVPSCECGSITGEYNVGITCANCVTEVKNPHGDLESFVWLRAPDGVAALINPTAWMMLTKCFTKGNFNLVHWLANDNYKTDAKEPEFLPIVRQFLEQTKMVRGINNFIYRFDEIMEFLFQLKIFKKSAADSHLEDFIRRYRDCIFSKYIPLPNKTLLVIEETNSGAYIDPINLGALNAIHTLVGIDSSLSNFSIKQKERRTIGCIDRLAEFYLEYYKTTLAKKEGIFRKHVYGTRSHFSFRAVISSITDPHNYDEIEIPWGVAVSVLKLHLTNKLILRGMNPNQINGFLYAHADRYSPLLDQLFQELINEAPDRGIDCVLNRNPSLMRGSCQALKITKVKIDPTIPTIGMSILICKSFNADFDGDALNCTLSIDNRIARAMDNLAPHKSSFGLEDHRGVTSSMMHPKPLVTSLANWLETDD